MASDQFPRALSVINHLSAQNMTLIGKLDRFINAISEAYADTFAPDYPYRKQTRNLLETILWETEEPEAKESMTRKEWNAGMRENGKALYESREMVRKLGIDPEPTYPETCETSGSGCPLVNPDQCAIHGPQFARIRRILSNSRYGKQDATENRMLLVIGGHRPPNLENPFADLSANTPNGGDGIEIALPGMFAAAAGFRIVPEGSGGAVSYRTKD